MLVVYAPDSSEDMEMYEAFISSVLRVLREGRRGGATEFYTTGDLNVEVGMMCTDEKDIEELNEMYGPPCWQGYDQDAGGSKKLMWYGIMKEFNCKFPCTWAKCGRAKETATTHRQHGDRRQAWITSLGPEGGTMMRICTMMSNCATRGITTPMRGHKILERRRTKKWIGWRPRTDEQHIEFKKKVMENGEDGIDEDFTTIQKTIEIAAGAVTHHTKAEKEKLYKVRRGICDHVRKLLQDPRKRSRGKCSRNKPEKPGLSTW